MDLDFFRLVIRSWMVMVQEYLMLFAIVSFQQRAKEITNRMLPHVRRPITHPQLSTLSRKGGGPHMGLKRTNVVGPRSQSTSPEFMFSGKPCFVLLHIGRGEEILVNSPWTIKITQPSVQSMIYGLARVSK
ncbi:hypothetical protein C8240_20765 [Paracidovorax cattleyae]|nr:hypothetical protein C8240_20765 [Paracidovorax cattleyae]